MFRTALFRLAIVNTLCVGVLGAGMSPVRAARPAAELLPASTKGYLSIPDMNVLREKWNETQFGQMMNDPLMEPFVEDLKRQIRAKLSKTDERLGIRLEDLQEVYGGEVCIAVLQPWDAGPSEGQISAAAERSVAAARRAGKSDREIAELRAAAMASAREALEAQRREQRAMVLLVDVTGHVPQAEELLGQVARDLKARRGRESRVSLGGIDAVHYVLPSAEAGQPDQQIYYVIHQDQLLVSDHAEVATAILQRFSGEHRDTLQQTSAFQIAMEKSQAALGESTPHIRWFLEPFGYVEAVRAYEGGRRRRGTDLLRVLSNQGFDAVRGWGGLVALSGDYDIRHHSYVSAPAIGESGRRYRLAANMLDFPNSKALDPEFWIPNSLSSYLTFHWKMQNAFEYARTLVDELAGDEVFEDVLKSIESDPNGPQINLREELVAHLAERVTVISDYRLPIDPKSERLLFAIELTNPMAVVRTVDKAMESDPAAKRREHDGHTIWEILNDEPIQVEAVQIDGFGFGFEEPEAIEDPEKPLMPNSAVTVAFGHLLVASHVDYIVEILERPANDEQLTAAPDFRAVVDALAGIGAAADAFRFFTRTDEAYRPTYELVRQGRMPEAETLLGKLLNRLWEPEEEGTLRPQFVDGSKMPEFEAMRKYLGPAGLFVHSEEQGWSVGGLFLERAE